MPFDDLKELPGPAAIDPGGPPSTVGEVWDVSLKAQREINNPLSRQNVLDEEYEKTIASVEKATGVRLFHPRRDQPAVEDWQEAQQEPDGWRSSVSQGAAMAAAERRFHRELYRLREAHPDKAADLGTDTVWQRAYARVRQAEQTAADVTARSPLSMRLPVVGDLNPVALGASFWGFLQDPVNVLTSVIGPGGSAAKGILWNAARQAAAGAVQQAAVEPFVQSWRREAGLDFGISQAALNVAMSGVFGGAVDAAGRTAFRAARGVPLSGTPEAPIARDAPAGVDPRQLEQVATPSDTAVEPVSTRSGDALADLEAAARARPEDDVIRRAAEGDKRALVELAETVTRDTDDPAIRGALDQMRDDVAQEASIAEALGLAAEEDRLARRILADISSEVDRAAAHVADPETVPPQHPMVPDLEAFWDPETREPMTIADVEHVVSMWEYVRDNKNARQPQSLTQFLIERGGLRDDAREIRHVIGAARERPGLVNNRAGITLDDAALAAYEAGFLGSGERPTVATLLDAIAEDVRGNRIVRDVDAEAAADLATIREMEAELDQLGIPKAKTADDVRNHFRKRQGDEGQGGRQEDIREALREGLYDEVDAARLIRAFPDLAAEVATTTDTGRGIHALSRLSDLAFEAVQRGEVSPEMAAMVAEAAAPARHADLVQRLIDGPPRDMAHARRIVAEALQAPTDAGTGRMILGDDISDLAESPTRAEANASTAPDAMWASEGAITKAAERQAEALGEVEARVLDAATGEAEAPTWIRDIAEDIEAAEVEANEAALIAACRIGG